MQTSERYRSVAEIIRNHAIAPNLMSILVFQLGSKTPIPHLGSAYKDEGCAMNKWALTDLLTHQKGDSVQESPTRDFRLIHTDHLWEGALEGLMPGGPGAEGQDGCFMPNVKAKLMKNNNYPFRINHTLSELPFDANDL
jgi:hypothetical protein